jgi:hypothetical protein
MKRRTLEEMITDLYQKPAQKQAETGALKKSNSKAGGVMLHKDN